MRTIIGAAVLALGLAAQPALADTAVQPTAGEGAATLLSVASMPTLAVATTAATSPFRLGLIEALTTPTSEKGAAILHRRLGTGMMDFYTAGGDTGFHLSAGSRLFQRRNFLAETAASAGGVMAGPATTSTATTTRAGFKKFNPALTAGYSIAVSRMAKIGVEAGAMMSGAFSNTPGLSRFGVGYRSEHEFRPDAIVNFAMGLRF